MTKEEIYNAWAPEAAIWSPWAKPVLFAYAEHVTVDGIPPAPELTSMNWMARSDRATLIIADLPGAESVRAGLLLAAIGYRPVPLFNALPGPAPSAVRIAAPVDLCTVDMRPILIAMALAVPALTAMKLADDAPPAFLLDANRRLRNRTFDQDDLVFDNRSISLPTDFPSANLLLSRGISRAVVIQPTFMSPQTDLAHTLLRWQQAGISIFVKPLDQVCEPQPVTISRPSFYRVFFYNLMATFGLRPSLLGGFGGWLPEGSAG